MRNFLPALPVTVLRVSIFSYGVEKNKVFTNIDILAEECKSISTIKSASYIWGERNAIRRLTSGPRSRQTYGRHK